MGSLWDNGDRRNALDWRGWLLAGVAVGVLVLCLVGAGQ